MTTSIAVLVPSRGRPQNIARLIKGFEETAADLENTHLIVGVDDDDVTKDEYLKLAAPFLRIIVGPRLRLAGTLNEIAVQHMDSYDILGFMGDDHLPRTKGWDDRMRADMVPMGVLYGNDLIQGPNLPTEVFLDSEIVKRLGYYVPKGFIHLFLDNTWKTWGERVGTLKYLNDVVIEHLHFINGKAEHDAGYVEVNAPEVWSADEVRYNTYVSSGELDEDIRKLRA